MKEISKEDANNVSGGMKWHGMRESKNVIDTRSGVAKTTTWSLYIDLCKCLILICSIQHQMKANLWTKNNCRLWLTELVHRFV